MVLALNLHNVLQILKSKINLKRKKISQKTENKPKEYPACILSTWKNSYNNPETQYFDGMSLMGYILRPKTSESNPKLLSLSFVSYNIIIILKHTYILEIRQIIIANNIRKKVFSVKKDMLKFKVF